ncbi:unnamed protein product [Ectocarpus sp. CCAP 1310/34]|nr:unnamed protein product [Ectocarpus sp. CCAP 1310/34]
MPLAWPKSLPLIFMAAAPLLLVWAPARALLGAAVSRLPSSTTRLLSCSQNKVRRRRGASTASRTLSCSSRSSSRSSTAVEDGAAKVIVIAGPTATGKSSVALALCRGLGGEIVSCDSVQVYRDVFIGCNKPSPEEMNEVRHHLVDVAPLDETFTAGDFVQRAEAAIDDILSRGRVPVVVGGTMMYLHWLVHGKPDAPKKDPAVAQAVATELLPFHDRGDWDGALELLAAVNSTRAASMARNDWYRLSRSLEVLRVPNDTGEEVFTGVRTPINKKYDFRSFFIIGDRERLFRRIDKRCEEMLMRGLLPETADLLVRGMLDPASPAGRAIGYRQAIDFLLQEARLADDLRPAPGGASGSADANHEATDVRATAAADPETRFLEFFHAFAAKTRQYSGEQMKWFRSSKGRDFSWQAWDLGGPIEEVPRRAGRGEKRGGGAKSHEAGSCARAGDGCGWRDVTTSITEQFELPRERFDEDLGGEYQAMLRSENRQRAGDMKRYVSELSLLGGGGNENEALGRLVLETKELAARIRQAQPERFRDGAITERPAMEVQGWHAGNR